MSSIWSTNFEKDGAVLFHRGTKPDWDEKKFQALASCRAKVKTRTTAPSHPSRKFTSPSLTSFAQTLSLALMPHLTEQVGKLSSIFLMVSRSHASTSTSRGSRRPNDFTLTFIRGFSDPRKWFRMYCLRFLVHWKKARINMEVVPPQPAKLV